MKMVKRKNKNRPKTRTWKKKALASTSILTLSPTIRSAPGHVFLILAHHRSRPQEKLSSCYREILRKTSSAILSSSGKKRTFCVLKLPVLCTLRSLCPKAPTNILKIMNVKSKKQPLMMMARTIPCLRLSRPLSLEPGSTSMPVFWTAIALHIWIRLKKHLKASRVNTM